MLKDHGLGMRRVELNVTHGGELPTVKVIAAAYGCSESRVRWAMEYAAIKPELRAGACSVFDAVTLAKLVEVLDQIEARNITPPAAEIEEE